MKRIAPNTSDEALDEVERELMDPDTWDWDSTDEGRTLGTPGAILCVRFTRDEILAIERIARRADIGPEELLRRTMLARLEADNGS